MLNDKESGSVGSMPSTSDLFSLITETNNITHQRSLSVRNESNDESVSSSSSNIDGSGDFQRGTLILEGEEQTSSKRSENTYSDGEKFTVPESVFLPSEIGTLEGQLCNSNTNNHQDNSEQESRKSHNADNEQNCSYNFLSKQLLAHGIATFVVVVGMLLLSTWKSLAWRSEAQHLKEVLHLQMQHHSSLELKIASLEADLAAWNKRQKDPHNWKFEKGHWEIDDDDDDNTVLSFKNCYLEASLALGQCSKKWQDWFLGRDGADSDEGQGDADGDEFATDEDGFTDDVTRLVDGIIYGVAAVSSNSFSFVEKTLKQMSEFYYFGDDFNASADSWNESEINQVLSTAIKSAESAVGEAQHC